MPKERIGIMGGSFNPIHNRHLEMAACAKKEYKLSRILFLPTGNPPHKHEELMPAEDRFEMTRLAVFGQPDFIASRMEIDREGIIYTVDTLARLQKQMPDASFDFIIGEDALEDLPHWHKPDKLFSMCRFLVCCRDHEDISHHSAIKPLQKRGATFAFLTLPPSDTSSTAIRRILGSDGRTPDLPPQVLEYIHVMGLYGVKESPKGASKLYTMLKKELSDKRLVHSLLVAATARELAYMHGVNPEQAALAGLLHDCAKCMPLASMQKWARENRLLLDKETLQNGNLLHGPVGAVVAEKMYGITDPLVLSAIRCHTTGKVGMLPLDMIVFLADKIEPSRKSYPALEKVRSLAQKNLASALRYSLESTLTYVRSQNAEPHPLTQQVADWLKRIAKTEESIKS